MGQLLDCRNHKTHLSGKVLTEIPPIIGKPTFRWVCQHYYFSCPDILPNHIQLEVIINLHIWEKTQYSFIKFWHVNIFGLNVLCWILKALFAAGELCHPEKLCRKAKVFNKTAAEKNNSQTMWIENNCDFQKIQQKYNLKS